MKNENDKNFKLLTTVYCYFTHTSREDKILKQGICAFTKKEIVGTFGNMYYFTSIGMLEEQINVSELWIGNTWKFKPIGFQILKYDLLQIAEHIHLLASELSEKVKNHEKNNRSIEATFLKEVLTVLLKRIDAIHEHTAWVQKFEVGTEEHIPILK